jgi:hypothetical protein
MHAAHNRSKTIALLELKLIGPWPIDHGAASSPSRVA